MWRRTTPYFGNPRGEDISTWIHQRSPRRRFGKPNHHEAIVWGEEFLARCDLFSLQKTCQRHTTNPTKNRQRKDDRFST
jgi:hypothetical protein